MRRLAIFAALQSLFMLNPPNLEEVVRVAVGHADSEVVLEATRATMRLDDAAAADILSALLKHRSWDVRRGAAESLANRGLPVSADLVASCLDVESEPIVRKELERLLKGGSA